MHPMISIIVPVYNVDRYLTQCLDSLINQTYRDIEIICINDGSTDRSPVILRDYAKKDSRIILIDRENRGISKSRNEALSVATGEWVLFVDSDDWVDTDICRLSVETAERENAGVVLWSYIREFGTRSLPKYVSSSNTVWEGKSDCRMLQRRILGPVGNELGETDKMDAWGTVWGKLYLRSLIETHRIRFVDTQVIGSAEDVLFNLAYFYRIEKAVYLHVCKYHYRKIAGGSFTSVYKPGLPEKWNNLYQKIACVLQEQGSDPSFYEAFYNRISLGIIGLGLNEVSSKASVWDKKRNIQALLNRSAYRNAVTGMCLSYFPFHWKVFFFCSKKRIAWGVLFLLMMIRRIINK